MIDPQALSQAISARIAAEFGMKALAVIEGEEHYRALQSSHDVLSAQVQDLTQKLTDAQAEIAELKKG